MALYDHRVFKADDNWYVAQVHLGSGAGWGDTTPRIRSETVIFTNLTQRDEQSSSGRIPAGWLNELSHGSLIRVLKQAKPLGSRFDMSPYNSPSDEESGSRVIVDEEGLKWMWQPVKGVVMQAGLPATRNAIQFVCLDDSALRKEIGLADDTVLDDFIATHGSGGLASLIPSIKATFRDFDPKP